MKMMPKTTRRQRVQTSLAELGAAIPIGAIGLLLTNDRVLKSTFHNAATGKLSDIAICFLLPLLVSATLGMFVAWTAERRLWSGAAVTTVVFSALEMLWFTCAAGNPTLPSCRSRLTVFP